MTATAPADRKAVVYYDSHSKPHPALVTARWSDTCVNVLFLTDGEAAVDPHGQQIDRQTSQVHASFNDMKSCCWDNLEDHVFDELVLFTDEDGDERFALVTKILDGGKVNLATITKGEDESTDEHGQYTKDCDRDSYGWKLERKLGVSSDKIRSFKI